MFQTEHLVWQPVGINVKNISNSGAGLPGTVISVRRSSMLFEFSMFWENMDKHVVEVRVAVLTALARLGPSNRVCTAAARNPQEKISQCLL